MTTGSRPPLSTDGGVRTSLDPRRWPAAERQAVEEALAATVASGNYVLGEQLASFEREFARWVRADRAVGVGNGTDALALSLMALELRPGSEVLVAANAGYFASLAAVRAGLVPVAVDVCPETLLMDPADLEARITGRTRAVVWTHLYGQLTDLSDVALLLRERNLLLIEDCAQVAGATVGGRSPGSWGIAGAWSFYPTKNLGALGDGGAVTTGDQKIADMVVALRSYGEADPGGRLIRAGLNSRLDEMQAAVLRARIPFVTQANRVRRQVCGGYRLAAAGSAGRVIGSAGDEFNGHLAVLVAADRDRISARLRANGIETRVRYPVPIHRAPAFEQFAPGPRPVAEQACASVLCLPVTATMNDWEVSAVCEALASAPS